MATYTKGNWREVAQMPNGYTIENEQGQIIAFIQDDENENNDPQTVITGLESSKNAQLIASAPEMLQALQYLTKEIDLNKLNIKKDFSLLNAHSAALKIIQKIIN